MAMQGYMLRGQRKRLKDDVQEMTDYQLFMSRKNAAVVSLRWLSASSFCSCFTRSSLSVVPRQLNWCSKCWSRSLLRSMVADFSSAQLLLNAPCDDVTTLSTLVRRLPRRLGCSLSHEF